jgi:aspartate kinase
MSLVLKFGGSSVRDAGAMRRVAERVQAALPRAPLVVLSAMGKTTDALFAAAVTAAAGDVDGALAAAARIARHHREQADELLRAVAPAAALEQRAALAAALDAELERLELLLRGVALLRELTPRTRDQIVATGELLSTRLFAAHLAAAGEGSWFDARTVIRTDAGFGRAQPDGTEIRRLACERLRPLLGPGRAVVTQGYVGATADGLTTTLGRGGSDWSAALFGAALDAEEVQIWTDVEGVMTCDPRLVPEALPIAELSFAEAAELAAFGAKVLHPATIQPAVEAGIPVTVRHTERPEGRFTTITARRARDGAGRPITALASRGPVTVLTVTSTRMLQQSGFLARLFEVFARHGVSVDLVATAEVSVSLTVEADVVLAPLVAELSAFAAVAVAERRAILAVVGERLKTTAGLGAQIFGALGPINVEMISMGANEINLSLVVEETMVGQALRRLHRLVVAPVA